MISFEMFAQTSTSPDRLWSVVGDVHRLPDWTDAEEVRLTEPLEEGAVVGVRVGEVWREWTILTLGARIWEARAETDSGRLGIGTRVAADPRGSRLVLAGGLEPRGSRLRARALTVPRLRSRFDRWTQAALSAARGGP